MCDHGSLWVTDDSLCNVSSDMLNDRILFRDSESAYKSVIISTSFFNKTALAIQSYINK